MVAGVKNRKAPPGRVNAVNNARYESNPNIDSTCPRKIPYVLIFIASTH